MDEPSRTDDLPPDEAPPVRPPRGFRRRLLRAVVVVACLAIVTLVIGLAGIETPWFKQWLRRYIERRATSVLDGELSIGRLQGNLLTHVELDRVVLAQRGEPVVSIDRVNVRYSLFEIVARGLVLDEVLIERPAIVVRHTADGWNVTRLVRARTDRSARPGPSVAIPRLRVADGRLVVHRAEAAPPASTTATQAVAARPARIDDLDAELGLASGGGALAIDVTHVSFAIVDPALRVGHGGGRIERRGDRIAFERVRVDLPASNVRVDGAITGLGTAPVADLTVVSTGLAFREVGLFLPALAPIPLQPAFTARLRGPLDVLDTELHLQSTAGRADGRVLVDFSAGQRRFAGELAVESVNPAPWASAPAFAGTVTGRARFDLRLPEASRKRPFTGTFHFTGPRADAAGYAARDVDVRGRLSGAQLTIESGRALAYGAQVTVAGVIEPVPGDAPGVQYSLEGRARRVDLRRLPATVPVPDLESSIDADYTVSGRGTDFNGAATLDTSTIEGAEVAAGTVGHFSSIDRRIAYGGSGDIAGLDLPRFGRALEMDALTDPRLAGVVNGTFTLDASGRTVEDLRLTADAHVNSSRLLGAELPDMVVKTSIERGRLTADLAGDFSSLAPEFVTGRPDVAGVLTGRVDGRVTLADLAHPLTIDTVGFDGRIDLRQSTLRGIEIAEAHVEGGFAGRAGRIDEATATGPLGDFRASGTLSLDTTGSSRLEFGVSRADLAGLSALAGQTLGGTAAIDGVLTGNAAALAATGTAHVEQAVVAEPVRAGTVDARYSLTLRDLDPAQVAVTAEVSARALTVAGQPIEALGARVEYAPRAVTFDARAIEGTRTLDARGRVDLLEGRQHVVLSALAASVDGLSWQLASGREVAVDHDGRQLDVTGLSLTHGDARVDADGTIAVGPGVESALEIRVSGLPLVEINRLLRRPAPAYAGILSGIATIGGTHDRSEIVSRFAITEGRFRELRFEEIGGVVHYDGRFLGTDVTLVQQPGTTLTARGLVPLSLLQGDDAAKGQDPIDLRVTTSTIGLAVVSGLTTALTDLSGTARIDLHVTGTADNPLFEGGVDLSDGAFTIVQTGRHYTGLRSTLRFEPGRMIIDGLRVLDEAKDPLDVTGELGLRRGAFGTVGLQVRSHQFGVVRNELGTVDVDADLRIVGEVTAPKVEGDVTLHSGRIEVDRVLDRLTGGAYSTEPVDDVPVSGVGITADEPPTIARVTTESGRTRSIVVSEERPSGDAGRSATAKPERAAARGPVDGATLDVRVKIPDNLILRGRDIHTSSTSLGLGNVNITVGGDFRVRRDPGTPMALVGNVNTVRGSYDFRGRRFEILRDGRIQFQGTQPIDPALDVTAQRVIQPSGVEARIRVQGTAKSPTLSFSSTPPMEEADILALIVFNRPLNSLGSSEQSQLVGMAGATAAGFVVAPITDSLGRALNLDRLEVQAVSEGGSTGGLVTIGQQLGERVYFEFRQQFGSQEVSEFVLEYQLAPFLRLQGAMADGDGVGRANRSLTRRVERAGLDLVFYFSY